MLRKAITDASLPEDALDALGNSERRRVVQILSAGPASVGELAGAFDISRPAISRHLARLERAGLVAHRAEGTRNVYFLDRTGLRAITAWLNRFWDEAEARSGRMVESGAVDKAHGDR